MKNVHEVSWFLQEAISHALSVLGWFENYMEEELPPENLWDDPQFIDEHFKKVRDKKFGDSGTAFAEGEESPAEMAENDLASVFKR